MSLVPDYSGSSESSDESSNSDVEDQSKTDAPAVKLPPPDFKVKTINDQCGIQTNSVFKNPFLEAENEKEVILEKHVKMVDLNNTVVINGKKICWNYRKGRCRFGHNCKFAHDSDIQKTPEQLENEAVIVQMKGVVAHKDEKLGMIKNEEESKSAKRKRPGLTQGLIPGKKVMKNYVKQKK